jgi:phage protein U
MSNPVQMILGSYIFSIRTAAYQSLVKKYEWVWASTQRFGTTPSLQYTGKKSPTVTLKGTVYPEFNAGIWQLYYLKYLADQEGPLLLATGYGDVMGYWVITALTEEQPQHLEGGIPAKQNFTLELKYYGDSISVSDS